MRTVGGMSVFGPVVQIAYVVDDPAVAAQQWHERHGAGPFFLRQHIAVTDVVHRGEPTVFDHTSAYGWMGGVMVELFCQHDRAPSAVTERFGPGEGGLHHMACIVDDYDAALRDAERLGMSVATTAKAGTLPFAFIDDRAANGHYWEVYPSVPRLLDFYAMVRHAHEHPDGGDVVREVA
jgi:hypothetical protein